MRERESMGKYAERMRMIEAGEKRVEELYTDYQETGKERVGIDSELREGMAIFFAMGLETDNSCWGHPERRGKEEYMMAEQNLLPYIQFTGYEPTDGLDVDGRAVGYSPEQVEVACTRMKRDAGKIKALVRKFYEGRQDEYEQIVFNYDDAMELPGARLHTPQEYTIEDLSAEEQDEVIAKAREQWEAFMRFVKEEYLKNG